MGQSETLLLVGAFAKRAGLSSSALRYYDDVGLLKPARVDETTGYRYYSEAQLEQAELIHFLRSLELPLGEIRATLAATDPTALAAHLKGYRRDVRAQLDEKILCQVVKPTTTAMTLTLEVIWKLAQRRNSVPLLSLVRFVHQGKCG